eukprot:1975970-Prymnesium_polylepis.2
MTPCCAAANARHRARLRALTIFEDDGSSSVSHVNLLALSSGPSVDGSMGSGSFGISSSDISGPTESPISGGWGRDRVKANLIFVRSNVVLCRVPNAPPHSFDSVGTPEPLLREQNKEAERKRGGTLPDSDTRYTLRKKKKKKKKNFACRPWRRLSS